MVANASGLPSCPQGTARRSRSRPPHQRTRVHTASSATKPGQPGHHPSRKREHDDQATQSVLQKGLLEAHTAECAQRSDLQAKSGGNPPAWRGAAHGQCAFDGSAWAQEGACSCACHECRRPMFRSGIHAETRCAFQNSACLGIRTVAIDRTSARLWGRDLDDGQFLKVLQGQGRRFSGGRRFDRGCFEFVSA